MGKKKQPERVCEIPRVRLPGPDGPRHLYIEAFPNEPTAKVKQIAEEFERGLKILMEQGRGGIRRTASGLMVPN